MFQIDITSDLNGLFADPGTWDGLTRGVPFRTTSWLGPWWRCYGSTHQAYVLVARDASGEIQGILPLYRRQSLAGGRVLANLGDGRACTDHVSVLAHEEHLSEIALAMGTHLASKCSSPDWGWDSLEIDGIAEGDPGMTAMMRGLQSAGATLHATSRMHVWYRAREASWEDHLRSFSKTHRRRTRRWIEAIGDDQSFQQRTAKTEAQALDWIDRMIEMHQRRWTAVGHSGSFDTPTFRQFILEAARSFFARGQLFVTVLEHAGEIIAAELNLIGADRIVYSYSSGFDTRHAEQEPGRILGTDTLRQLYQRSLTGIDYLRGDEIYKQRYSTQSRRLIQLRAVAPAFVPRLRHAAWQTQFELKQWARKQTGRQPLLVLDPTSNAGCTVVQTAMP